MLAITVLLAAIVETRENSRAHTKESLRDMGEAAEIDLTEAPELKEDLLDFLEEQANLRKAALEEQAPEEPTEPDEASPSDDPDTEPDEGEPAAPAEPESTDTPEMEGDTPDETPNEEAGDAGEPDEEADEEGEPDAGEEEAPADLVIEDDEEQDPEDDEDDTTLDEEDEVVDVKPTPKVKPPAPPEEPNEEPPAPPKPPLAIRQKPQTEHDILWGVGTENNQFRVGPRSFTTEKGVRRRYPRYAYNFLKSRGKLE